MICNEIPKIKNIEKTELLKLGDLLSFFPLKIYEDLTKSIAIDKEKQLKNIKFLIKKRGRNYKNLNDDTAKNINYQINKKGRIHDKFCSDNVRRRIKSSYHLYIIRLLNGLMKKKFKTIKMKFVKMNKKITNDISIEYNKNLLEKKIKDIIINISNKYQNKDNNKNCIKFIEAHKDNKELLNVLNITYEDLYTNYYLKSTKNDIQDNSYEAHKEKLLTIYGEEYLNKYIENSENFVKFFKEGKKRKNRKVSEVKEINIPSESESTKTISDNILLKDDCNNMSEKVQMISTSTQTDIYDINTKIISFI